MPNYRQQTAPHQMRAYSEIDPLQGISLAMAYVPWQHLDQTYDLEEGLNAGTIFPELNKPFLGKRGYVR